MDQPDYRGVALEVKYGVEQDLLLLFDLAPAPCLLLNQVPALLVDRHNRGVNVAFMDGSSRKVFLTDLWRLKWHRDFEQVGDIDIPWLN